MLSNQFYDNESERLRDLINGLESDLMDDVSLMIGDNTILFTDMALMESDEQQIAIQAWENDKLSEETRSKLGQNTLKTVERTAVKQPREIDKIIQDATNTILNQKEGVLSAAATAGVLRQAPPISESVAINGIIQRVQGVTKLQYRTLNFTMSLSANQRYADIIGQVTADVIEGRSNPTQALSHWINQLGDDGLTGFIDRAGRTWQPETYGDLLIRTNTKEAAFQSTLARADEYGNNYIEISSSSEARELCALDQGQIFSLDNDTTPIKDGDGNSLTVRAWSSSTHDQPAGILKINCTHQGYNFVAGWSSRTFENTDEIGKEKVKQNNKERERQRQIERNIKTNKRKAVMFENTGDAAGQLRAQNGIYNWQAEMRTFIDDTGRVRRNNREQIFTSTGNLVTQQPRGIKPTAKS